jgi:hypothetical protein
MSGGIRNLAEQHSRHRAFRLSISIRARQHLPNSSRMLHRKQKSGPHQFHALFGFQQLRRIREPCFRSQQFPRKRFYSRFIHGRRSLPDSCIWSRPPYRHDSRLHQEDAPPSADARCRPSGFPDSARADQGRSCSDSFAPHPTDPTAFRLIFLGAQTASNVRFS